MIESMSIEDIKTDIEHIQSSFKDLILDNLIKIDNSTISWNNYITGISKNMYAEEFEELVNNRQYSYLLKNKGFIQIYFNFKNNRLLKAKLAYYPYPVFLHEDIDDMEGYYCSAKDEIIQGYYYDIYNIMKANLGEKIDNGNLDEERNFFQVNGIEDDFTILSKIFDEKYKITNSSHIRIDYDDIVTSHNKAEIQYSSINNIRLPLNKMISPFLFIDFIIRYEFPEFYEYYKIDTRYKINYNIALKHSKKIEKFKENNIFVSHI
jgi:hypothetical protein